MIALLLLACSSDCPPGSTIHADGLCHLIETTESDTASVAIDTGQPASSTSLPGFEWGDPISLISVAGQGPSTSGKPEGAVYEWLDGVVLNEEIALLTGQGGLITVDIPSGEITWQDQTIERGYRVDADGDLAAVGPRISPPIIVDLSAPNTPVVGDTIELFSGYHEDIAVDDGRILIGWLDNGAVLVDAQGALLSVLEADDAFAVGLEGERAVVTDDDELILWDVSDPTAPQVLDRVTLSGHGRDIAFDGQHLAVAMGGADVAVFSVADDVLTHLGALDLPGSSFSVSLDGDYLWIGAWEVVGLAWLGDGGPVMLGHEPPGANAMAVAAGAGRAVVADWYYATTMELNAGLAGPEIVVPEALWFTGDSAQSVAFENGGAFDLEVTMAPGDGFKTSETSLTLRPGERYSVAVTPPAGGAESTLEWTSNDPDEPAGQVALNQANQSIGAAHEDFELLGFSWPDGAKELHRLSDQRGSVVFLAYYALY